PCTRGRGETSCRERSYRRHLIPGAALQLAPRLLFIDAAPLLEEERYTRGLTLSADFDHPFLRHRPRSGPRFAADNRPMDAVQIEVRDRPQQWLDRQEADAGADTA